MRDRKPLATGVIQEAGSPKASALFVKSVEKAMGVLLAFDASNRRMSLSQLAERAQTDMSTAQRFAHTLESLGYLKKDKTARAYELSPKMLTFAYRYLQGSELIERTMPIMLHLSKATEAAINLMVQDDTDMVYMHRLHSRHLINPEIMVGARLPMFATASGLAMLAHMPEGAVDDILKRSNLRALTSFTVVSEDGIRRRLEAIRKSGYAIAHQETYLGDISLATVVLDARGLPAAALSISTSTLITSLEVAERDFAPLIVAAGANLSQNHRGDT